MKPLNKVLTERRNALGMSIEEVAKKAGIPKSTVSKIMCGDTPDPQYRRLEAIVCALQMTMDELGERVKENDCAALSEVIVLNPREALLLDRYRKLPRDGQQFVEQSALFASQALDQDSAVQPPAQIVIRKPDCDTADSAQT